MTYFTDDFLKFFKELERHNAKAWFDENRKRYETSVRKPFIQFIEDLIARVQTVEPDIFITPREALFRINRDIRFSKDKTPYKTHYSAVVSPDGKKNKTLPGLYVQLSHKGVQIYGGIYVMKPDQLKNVRTHIHHNLEEFQALISDKAFHKMYGPILGEKHKRVPKEFQEIAELEPLIANKQFYYGAHLPAKIITSDKLMDTIMDHWMTAKPLKDFLTHALRPKVKKP